MSIPWHKRARRRLRSAAIGFLARALSRLPLGWALALGALCGRLAYRFGGETRRQMLSHLARAFPEKPLQEHEAIARASLVHLAQLALEVIAVRAYDARLEEYVTFAGAGERLLAEAMARGRGLVFVTGHVGNWELLARRIGRTGVPNAVIARRSADERVNALMERFRAEGGVATLWREDPATARALIRNFRAGKLLGILVDQDTRVQGVFVPFFGRLAFTPRAAADLALRFGAPVVVGTCHRAGDRPGHVLELTEVGYDPDPADPEAEVQRITLECTRILEDAIRAHPAEWVWMHDRWKTRPGGENTPQAIAVPKTREMTGV
ncbi:lysophospholipid acyltransferase family protein [Anaeromyxobacter paludicola]|uniref:Lipid A biosynthesis acyltransferase n=1 Tax=Anaeromyxobacter paludicola TaxID=2918171 RepID=A0ABN6N9M4_9BACT|nr:lysophospholipid acyltransferase family protein [Anaeromyxobacter paludicola]BDG09919.1 lipid A biosynthesis acyltransferase [Anaeromyxobacter paludicola]